VLAAAAEEEERAWAAGEVGGGKGVGGKRWPAVGVGAVPEQELRAKLEAFLSGTV